MSARDALHAGEDGWSPTPSGFVRLAHDGPEPSTQLGCMFLLGGLLLTIGLGIIALFIAHPEGKGDMWVMPLVGGGFALVGAFLFFDGVRSARGLKIPTPDLFLGKSLPLSPGTTARVRLRQPGPVEIESLRLKVVCERVYQRRVKSTSSATVEDRETLWESVLLDVQNEHVPAGDVFLREVVLSVPADGRPTGPASPDGTVRWRLEVWGEAGFLCGTYRAFTLVVHGGAFSLADAVEKPDDQPGTLPSPEVRTAAPQEPTIPPPVPARPGIVNVMDKVLSKLGCLVIGAGFLLSGGFFLWAFFNRDTFSGKGNPYMGLVGGALFTTLGLIAVTVWALSLFGGSSRRSRDPRRLP
jgi:hypothetical protein